MQRAELDRVSSSRSSSAISSRGVSEGQSSASGASDTTDAPPVGGRGERAVNTSDAKRANTAALEAATVHCSMCDDAISSLLCTQCGRLSFCAPCCISLHDNKFLASHKLLSLEPHKEGETVTVAMLKERLQKKPQDAEAVAQSTVPLPEASTPSPTKRAAFAASKVGLGPIASHTDPSAGQQTDENEANIDMASLAADRNIIQARLVELASCRSLLQASSDSLSKERFRCKDIAHTATEAVRQRFDVLRTLLHQKESEYVAVVERAARSRLEDATKASFDASSSLAECDAFLDQTKLQLERLATNKKLFAEARASMLRATETKLRAVDDTIQRLQNDYDRIVSVSLGVQIPLDRVVDEVGKLVVPKAPQAPHHGDMHAKPISMEKFTASPGVKVVRQSSAEQNRAQQDQTQVRKSYQQEIEALRSTPLKDIRAQQQSSTSNGSVGPQSPLKSTVPLSLQQQAAAGSHESSNRLPAKNAAISRIAEKFATQQGEVGHRRTVVPKELESLRQVVASANASPSSLLIRKQSNASVISSASAAARARSPITASRAESPGGMLSTSHNRRASPMRQTQLSSYRNSISPSRRNPDATPGPGAYYKPTDFTARSMLSTPPRRR